jgi:hypothetical protein
MSYCYTISLSETVTRTVRVSDGIDTRLEIPPILGPEATAGLLADELAARGFSRDGEQMHIQLNDTTRVSIDLSDATVTIRAERHSAESITASVNASVARNEKDQALPGQRIKQLKDKHRKPLKQELDRADKQRHETRTRELADELEQQLPAIEALLDALSQAVASQALKIRAAELGEIQEISEDPETGELVIKVKV